MTAPALARRALATFDDLPISPRFAAGFVALLIAALGWLGWSWLRDSSLVQVEQVRVTGLTTRDAPAIRRTLRQAALRMTTLNYSEADLKRAVEPFPAVQSVSVDADLPHKLVISVREHQPVAALVSGDGRRVAVASDGTLLPHERDLQAAHGQGRRDPRRRPPRERGRVRPRARDLGGAGGAAPAADPRLPRPRRGAGRGRGGPTLRFGAPIRLAAKWAAAARVLADTPAAGAREPRPAHPRAPLGRLRGGGHGRRHGHAAGVPGAGGRHAPRSRSRSRSRPLPRRPARRAPPAPRAPRPLP